MVYLRHYELKLFIRHFVSKGSPIFFVSARFHVWFSIVCRRIVNTSLACLNWWTDSRFYKCCFLPHIPFKTIPSKNLQVRPLYSKTFSKFQSLKWLSLQLHSWSCDSSHQVKGPCPNPCLFLMYQHGKVMGSRYIYTHTHTHSDILSHFSSPPYPSIPPFSRLVASDRNMEHTNENYL